MLDQDVSPPIADDRSEPSARPTVLVVDDDTVHRMILTKVATRVGWSATGAATYEEAVALIGANAYDLITLDLTLGRRGGVEVLHALAAIGSATPVLIVSASPEAIREESAGVGSVLSLNVCGSLAKPVDLVRLRQVLSGLRERSTIGLAPVAAPTFR